MQQKLPENKSNEKVTAHSFITFYTNYYMLEW